MAGFLTDSRRRRRIKKKKKKETMEYLCTPLTRAEMFRKNYTLYQQPSAGDVNEQRRGKRIKSTMEIARGAVSPLEK